ncbi:MAG: DUF438 domain-containing protein [Sphaerochaetaceae bacterium]|jgi:DUF438 domain-containing protein|nr:DUF438 domain-containing protein [Sphaerochaetaceae bacterium]
MSAEINNNAVKRQEALRDLIARLHAGESVETVQQSFAEAFEGVSAQEIADAEQSLIASGVKVEEIQTLCDVHAAVFKGSIEEIHADKDKARETGHPVWLLKEENRAIERLFAGKIDKHVEQLRSGDEKALASLAGDLALLSQIDSHYSKKENLWFPIMERYGITAPPKVMWGVDDEIRAQLKDVQAQTKQFMQASAKPRLSEITRLLTDVQALKTKINDMIVKEESILIPMVSEVFFLPDWRKIREGTAELGYCLLDESVKESSEETEAEETAVHAKSTGTGIQLPTGSFTPEILEAVLNTLPIDMTFVDKNDEVLYFSQSSERVFPRTSAIIGRKVINCHPPASMHVVQKILDDFKSGKRDVAEFYIHLRGMYVHIRYFAVRNAEKEYLGTLEVTQNIAPIQAISGDKRLLDE